MTDKEKIAHYEKLLQQILQPLNEIPFDLFVKAVSGKRIIPVDERSQQDKKLVSELKRVVANAVKKLNAVGIVTTRPNEAGNKAEVFLKKALEESKLRLGKVSQSAGYPDVLIFDTFNRPTYLEVKTYNSSSKDSSLRSFFVSPSKRKSKIEFDARHLVVALQLKKDKGAFYAEQASVYDIAFLMGEIKREFNTSNRQLYASKYSKELFTITSKER